MTITIPPAEHDRYKPRLIIWQITPRTGVNGTASPEIASSDTKPLSLNECLLVIDSIARFSHPIIIFTGDNPDSRADLHDIVAYATALGIKPIIELRPEYLTEDVLTRYHAFGPKIFRIVIDGCIVEDPDTRYQQSPAFKRLEEAVHHLRDAGFEIHFSLTVISPDSRILGFNLDYAFRRSASGLYCHLCFNQLAERSGNGNRETVLDTFISEISELKPNLPSEMYFSPQCVKFGSYHSDETAEPESELQPGIPHWAQWCVAGKSFAFISENGTVRPCSRSAHTCGNVRSNDYDFRAIWMDSTVFRSLRDHRWSCAQTRHYISHRSHSRE